MNWTIVETKTERITQEEMNTIMHPTVSKREHKRIMKKRRMVTYTVLALLLLLVTYIANKLLMDAQLRSLNAMPEMVWYEDTLIRADVFESIAADTTDLVEPLPVVQEQETDANATPVTILPSAVAEPVVTEPVVTEVHGVSIVPYRTAAVEATDEEVLTLARLIESEAGIETYEGKVAVGTVVLNRVEHFNNKLFGATLIEVIYKGGQFDGVGKKEFNRTPSEDSMKAAQEVLGGYRRFGKEILYYFNRAWSTDNAFMDSMMTIIVIGRHEFCIPKN